jgi:hypothetical protein
LPAFKTEVEWSCPQWLSLWWMWSGLLREKKKALAPRFAVLVWRREGGSVAKQRSARDVKKEGGDKKREGLACEAL